MEMIYLAINQAYLFLMFSLNGLIIGLLFDIFRILRKTFKTNNFITYIEDILFWTLTGISIIFFMYNFSDGNLRIYMILGLIIGVLIYLITFSKIIINISIVLINIIKNIITFIARPIKKFLKFILGVLNLMIRKIIKIDKIWKKNTKINKK